MKGIKASDPSRQPDVPRLAAGSLIVLLMLALSAPVAQAARPPQGALEQLADPDGCVTTPNVSNDPVPGCANDGNGLVSAQTVVVSPDGGSVYVGSVDPNAGGDVALFERDRRTGALTQIDCFRDATTNAVGDCRPTGASVVTPTALALSPDGRTLYAASPASDSVAVFVRDRETGALTQLAEPDGCVGRPPPFHAQGCTIAEAMGSAFDVTVSPDGRNVYVATFFGIAAFARDRATGALQQLRGADGCLVQPVSAPPGCTVVGPEVANAASVEVSSDGRSVYLTSGGGPRQGAVVVFSRDLASGTLTRVPGPDGCLATPRLAAPRLGTPGLGNLREDTLPDCAAVTGLGQPVNLVIARSGRHVYVNSEGRAILSFERDAASGGLHQLPEPDGCIADVESPVEGCGSAVALGGIGNLAIATGDGNVYAASGVAPGVTAFSRDQRTGALSQLPGPAGCVVDEAWPDRSCREGTALAGANAIALDPSGRHAYVTGRNSVAVFQRTRRP